MLFRSQEILRVGAVLADEAEQAGAVSIEVLLLLAVGLVGGKVQGARDVLADARVDLRVGPAGHRIQRVVEVEDPRVYMGKSFGVGGRQRLHGGAARVYNAGQRVGGSLFGLFKRKTPAVALKRLAPGTVTDKEPVTRRKLIPQDITYEQAKSYARHADREVRSELAARGSPSLGRAELESAGLNFLIQRGGEPQASGLQLAASDLNALSGAFTSEPSLLSLSSGRYLIRSAPGQRDLLLVYPILICQDKQIDFAVVNAIEEGILAVDHPRILLIGKLLCVEDPHLASNRLIQADVL